MKDRQDNPQIAANQVGIKHGLTDRGSVPNTSLLQARILNITEGLPQQSTRLTTASGRRQMSIKAGFYANLLGLTRPTVGAAALAMLVMTSGGLYLSGDLFDSLPSSNSSEASKAIGLENNESTNVSLGQTSSRKEIDELEWQDILLLQDEIAFAAL